MAVLGAPVFPHGNLVFFVAIFSEMVPEEKQFREQVYAAVMKLPVYPIYGNIKVASHPFGKTLVSLKVPL